MKNKCKQADRRCKIRSTSIFYILNVQINKSLAKEVRKFIDANKKVPRRFYELCFGSSMLERSFVQQKEICEINRILRLFLRTDIGADSDLWKTNCAHSFHGNSSMNRINSSRGTLRI